MPRKSTVLKPVSPRQWAMLALSFALPLLFLQSCAGPSMMRKDGLSYIQLGDSMPGANVSELDGHPLTESIMEQHGYQWRVCTLAYETGQVLLESDFEGRTRVNRIRVETPEVKVKGGLKVGDQLTDMLQKTSKWNARPYVEYELMEVTSTKFPRKIFLLKVDGYDYSGEIEEVEASDLPGESKVVGIVMM